MLDIDNLPLFQFIKAKSVFIDFGQPKCHLLPCTFTSSRSDVFCKKAILKNFGQLTTKHLCQSPLFKDEACSFI